MECSYCEWRCELGADTYGVCRMYHADGDEIKERFPDRWSFSSSRMEALPFYHVWPGARTLTIGTRGCNFNCRYCSNAYVALADPATSDDHIHTMTPESLVAKALQLGCRNIVFNVNEPIVSIPGLLQLRRVAEDAGLPMGCLTNAYGTEESTETLATIFDFLNIGLKGFSSEFYRDYIGVKTVEPILRNIRTLAKLRHVEVTTPVIQGVNDDDLDAMAEYLADIDPEIPWHVFRLLPEYEMKDREYPSIEIISRKLEAARQKLHYVYFHNFVGSEWVNTICPGCGMEVVERLSLGCGGDKLEDFHCADNRCPRCGRAIRMCGEYVQATGRLATEGRVTA
ncbi:MAG: radical SAM protein [Acidobacteriota bacterium]|nr:radical SAM protein [Acidobacteriota bacterium]